MRITRLTAALVLLLVLSACEEGTVDPTSAPAGAAPAAALQAEGFATVGEIRTGWIINRYGEPAEVTFEVHSGRAIFEGDIDLGPADSIPSTLDALLAGPQRGVVRDGNVCSSSPCGTYRWPFGTVPYEIDPNLPNQSRVTDAIAHIEANNPGVNLKVRSPLIESNYIFIQPGNGCSSAVGRVGGRQTLTLADGCTTGNTTHEFLHALGMHHEHSRCDRNGFVEILWDNIQDGRESNFYGAGSTTRTGGCNGFHDELAYAEGSIMHYGAFFFGRIVNGVTLQTIRSLRDLESEMGQRKGMSTSDIQTVELMYPRATLSVTISGKQYIARYESAQYTATPKDGSPPYSYQWRTRDYSPSWGWGSWSNWFSTGTTNYTYASVNACGISRKELAVKVMDGIERTATNTYLIFITNPC